MSDQHEAEDEHPGLAAAAVDGGRLAEPSCTMNAPTTGPYSVPRPPTSADSTIITLPRMVNAPSGLRKVRKYA